MSPALTGKLFITEPPRMPTQDILFFLTSPAYSANYFTKDQPMGVLPDYNWSV